MVMIFIREWDIYFGYRELNMVRKCRKCNEIIKDFESDLCYTCREEKQSK
jgi:hypothetical protein